MFTFLVLYLCITCREKYYYVIFMLKYCARSRSCIEAALLVTLRYRLNRSKMTYLPMIIYSISITYSVTQRAIVPQYFDCPSSLDTITATMRLYLPILHLTNSFADRVVVIPSDCLSNEAVALVTRKSVRKLEIRRLM